MVILIIIIVIIVTVVVILILILLTNQRNIEVIYFVQRFSCLVYSLQNLNFVVQQGLKEKLKVFMHTLQK